MEMNKNMLRSMLGLLIAASASVGPSAHGAPVIIRDRAVNAIVQNSSTPVNLSAGSNPLDTPATFICKSAMGCVVVMTVAYSVKNVGAIDVCARVDGIEGNPTCAGQLVYGLTREQLNISQGSHTIATTVTVSQDGGQIPSWETDYVIYAVHDQAN
jgi:hypothetical protein